MGRVFLTAEWRHLALLNYEVDPALLAARVPPGTVLDLFQGRAFVSLVGFRFLNTSLRGIPIPFHRDFDEVNLRFYVRRCDAGVVKRGVVFIQEIVPRWAIAAIARWAYHENYRALPMSHVVIDEGAGPRLEYRWRLGNCWSRIAASATGAAHAMVEGSIEQFITEHYWGYCAQPDGRTMEYHVAHPSWRVWNVASAEFSGDAEALYGPQFATILNRPPDSTILAEGSPVTVYAGKKLPCY
ncbi:MAG TPA: DUF2071 domain-containing protein [Bryobacteraceae bacterium]|nr:DUF2071 domain-containing protein [Bryobacteraceae bacterium]